MSACEVWSDPPPDREGCLWCGKDKRAHQAGDCRDCLGYGHLLETVEGHVMADRTLDVDGEPVTCLTCAGTGIVDREGRPVTFQRAKEMA